MDIKKLIEANTQKPLGIFNYLTNLVRIKFQ